MAVIIVESKSSSKPAVIPVVIDEKAVEEILGVMNVYQLYNQFGIIISY